MNENFFEKLYWQILTSLPNTYSPTSKMELKRLEARDKSYGFLRRFFQKYLLRNLYEPRNNIGRLLTVMSQYSSVYKDIEEHLFSHLEDNTSKDLLIKVLSFRLLGPEKVLLPYSNEKWQKQLHNAEVLFNRANDQNIINAGGYCLKNVDLVRIQEYQSKLQLYSTPEALNILFGYKQYEYSTSETKIRANRGDIVLDCGGCWGDTSLYFGENVGASGKVYSFEFIKENLSVFQKNLTLNPTVRSTIEIIKSPVWSKSNEKVFISNDGPGSRIDNKDNGSYSSFITTTIDDFVSHKQLNTVDFIKMDIEGAEPSALEGAKKTIIKYKPKLAICVYHDICHFYLIPKMIKEFEPRYKLYLKHSTDTEWETVLFAEYR